jgi:hypothetical protein
MSVLPHEPAVAIAVLYERLGHVIEKVDALSEKIDKQSKHRDEMIGDLEVRIDDMEKQFSRIKWFLVGLAAGGGALGGSLAAGLVRLFGG